MALGACTTGGGTHYTVVSTWADKNDLYILYQKDSARYVGTILNPHSGTPIYASISYRYLKLDKSKIRDGDEIDLTQGDPTDLIYQDGDFSVERMYVKSGSRDSKTRITTGGRESTVVCKEGVGRRDIVPIRLADKLIYCGYIIPVGGVAVAGPRELFDYRLEYGIANGGAIYFYGSADYHSKEPIVVTKLDTDAYKVSGKMSLPLPAPATHREYERVRGHFRHGFIIAPGYKRDAGIVYACMPEKCREFHLIYSYSAFSSALFVEDSGDALIALDKFSPKLGQPVLKVAFIKAEPDAIDGKN